MGLFTFKPEDPRVNAQRFTDELFELILPSEVAYGGWEMLMTLGFIDHPDGIGMATRLLSRRYAGRAGIREFQIRVFSNQVGLTLEPVSRGLGFTVLPRFARQALFRPGCDPSNRVRQSCY